jgi:hypothetical protein
MSPAKGRIAVIACLVLAVAGPGLAHSGATAREMRVVLLPSGVSAPRKAANVECALRLPVRAVLNRLNGFAVRLSEEEVGRLRADPEILLVLPGRGSWVVRIDSRDPAVVAARTRELEQQLGFTSDQRYNTTSYRGFAAVLDWSQLARLNGQRDLTANPDPWVYIVFYVPGVDVDARTTELEQRYGFTSRYRYRSLGGFSAELTKSQLAGIATEPDIQTIGPNNTGSFEPSLAACLRSTPGVRRQLRSAFVRAHRGLSGKPLRGPFNVRFGSSERLGGERSNYALARFTHPRLAADTQPEAFRKAGGTDRAWQDLAPTNGTLCDPDGQGIVPRDVLRAWLLRPAGAPNCYRTG